MNIGACSCMHVTHCVYHWFAKRRLHNVDSHVILCDRLTRNRHFKLTESYCLFNGSNEQTEADTFGWSFKKSKNLSSDDPERMSEGKKTVKAPNRVNDTNGSGVLSTGNTLAALNVSTALAEFCCSSRTEHGKCTFKVELVFKYYQCLSYIKNSFINH